MEELHVGDTVVIKALDMDGYRETSGPMTIMAKDCIGGTVECHYVTEAGATREIYVSPSVLEKVQ